MLEGARNIYWRLTVRENVQFFAALAGTAHGDQSHLIADLLQRFNLEEKVDTPVRELSRGQKQKVSLACTLARGAHVLFLDEPTLGLDVESSLELRSVLRNLVDSDGITVVLSSHDMDVIEDLCDRVIIMRDGTIVANETVSELLDVFNAQTYTISTDEQIPDETRQILRSTFSASDFSSDEEFTVRITNDEFYALVDTLREADLTVTEFSSTDPNLEDVFINLINKGTEDRTATEASQQEGSS